MTTNEPEKWEEEFGQKFHNLFTAPMDSPLVRDIKVFIRSLLSSEKARLRKEVEELIYGKVMDERYFKGYRQALNDVLEILK